MEDHKNRSFFLVSLLSLFFVCLTNQKLAHAFSVFGDDKDSIEISDQEECKEKGAFSFSIPPMVDDDGDLISKRKKLIVQKCFFKLLPIMEIYKDRRGTKIMNFKDNQGKSVFSIPYTNKKRAEKLLEEIMGDITRIDLLKKNEN